MPAADREDTAAADTEQQRQRASRQGMAVAATEAAAAAAASLAAAADAAGALWVWLGGRARAAFRGGQLAIDEPGGAGGRLQGGVAVRAGV